MKFNIHEVAHLKDTASRSYGVHPRVEKSLVETAIGDGLAAQPGEIVNELTISARRFFTSQTGWH